MIIHFPPPRQLRRSDRDRRPVRLAPLAEPDGDVTRQLHHRVLLLRRTGTDHNTAPEEVQRALATVRRALRKNPEQLAVAVGRLNPRPDLFPGY